VPQWAELGYLRDPDLTSPTSLRDVQNKPPKREIVREGKRLAKVETARRVPSVGPFRPELLNSRAPDPVKKVRTQMSNLHATISVRLPSFFPAGTQPVVEIFKM